MVFFRRDELLPCLGSGSSGCQFFLGKFRGSEGDSPMKVRGDRGGGRYGDFEAPGPDCGGGSETWVAGMALVVPKPNPKNVSAPAPAPAPDPDPAPAPAPDPDPDPDPTPLPNCPFCQYRFEARFVAEIPVVKVGGWNSLLFLSRHCTSTPSTLISYVMSSITSRSP